MIYVKAAIAGVAAVLVAGLVVFAVGISALIVYSFKSRSQETGIGWDIVAFARSAWAQLIGLRRLLLVLYGNIAEFPGTDVLSLQHISPSTIQRLVGGQLLLICFCVSFIPESEAP